ncbi:hypothetical protein ACHAWO_006302 [Cyclotella atomus]|uniref:ShKT domain-containing protein n=1 Tax=Cyclotella atomus TaxID=382360 RepID=A0ABD3NX25_9STRA
MNRNATSIIVAKSTNRRQRSGTAKESIWTTSLLKCLLVVTSGVLLPICPTFMLAMQSVSNSTASSFSHGLAAEPIVQSTHKTWQDYLKESSEEQVIDGTIDEKRGIQERLRHVEMYYQRWIANHQSTQDGHLRYRCSNRNKLCAYWASIGECSNNPMFMEDVCVLACMRCDRLTEE